MNTEVYHVEAEIKNADVATAAEALIKAYHNTEKKLVSKITSPVLTTIVAPAPSIEEIAEKAVAARHAKR